MRDQASPGTGFIRFSGDGVSALVDQDVRLTFVNVPAIELEPSQPTLSHHLKKLRDAGLVAVERRGQWAYYYVVPGALDPLSAWLGQ